MEGLPGQSKFHRDGPLGKRFWNPGFVSSRDTGLFSSLVAVSFEVSDRLSLFTR